MPLHWGKYLEYGELPWEIITLFLTAFALITLGQQQGLLSHPLSQLDFWTNHSFLGSLIVKKNLTYMINCRTNNLNMCQYVFPTLPGYWEQFFLDLYRLSYQSCFQIQIRNPLAFSKQVVPSSPLSQAKLFVFTWSLHQKVMQEIVWSENLSLWDHFVC